MTEIVTPPSAAFLGTLDQVVEYRDEDRRFWQSLLVPGVQLHPHRIPRLGQSGSEFASLFVWRPDGLHLTGYGDSFWAPFEQRYAELLRCAVEEQIQIKQRSEREMRAFLRAAGAVALPALFLLDDGTFRLIWRNEQGEQIGLQFLGNGMAQFVIFVRKRDGSGINRAAGQHDTKALQTLIEGNEAWRLLGP